MSIEALTSGDTVVVVKEEGGDFGAATTLTNCCTLDCGIQQMSQSESKNYADSGFARMYRVRFSEDPQLRPDRYLKWIARADSTVVSDDSPRWLRVLATGEQGPPGETWLWFADCGEDTTRRES